MEKNNTIVLVVSTMILGLVLGYMLASNNSSKFSGMHKMPDGQLMSNNGAGGMSGMMDDMMLGLNGKTGDDFDKAFLSEMIVHHQGAVLMAQSALQNAKHQEIKDLSTNIITAQNKEILQMQEWYKNWYNK
ncbi:MAG: hypothetical protein AB201_00240 [Parcubacteria bacterium C7867-006]|nr:MAG: hypothetical protein AB201_00240 [Parcubacteria bacterium C7867-006]